MKKGLLVLVLLMSLNVFSQAITVNTSQTPQQLVNTIVENSCLVQISNISSSTGTNFGSANGLGSYQNTNPLFPVTSSGIVLSTGQASLSPGPNTSTLSNGGAVAAWGGNVDLEAALASAGITVDSKNATMLEFNFVPNGTSFDLDFLFASEEYGTFQCESNDSFVVLLTNLNTGVTTNVALIPSTSTPITVMNIRNNLYNSGCPALNAAFFGSFNGGSNAAGSATNFNGQTVLLHASGVLVPNNQYNIKFIIADDGGLDGTDGDFDSAVFIPAGGLNLGQQVLGEDKTIANGNPACFGEAYLLDTGLDPALYDFQWLVNNGPIPGETGPSYAVTTGGSYGVAISRPDISCNATQTINIEFAPEIVAGEPLDLYECEDGSPSYSYTLSDNTPVLTQGLPAGTTVEYYASEINALGDVNSLPLTYNSPSNVTIWARVQDPSTNCFVLKTFDLLAAPGPVAGQPQNLTLCENAQGSNTAVFNLLQQNDMVLNGNPANQFTITYHTTLAAANSGTDAITLPQSFTGTDQIIYVRLQQNFAGACHSVKQFDLVVLPLPVLPASSSVNQCNNYTLPALSSGNYYTGNGGTGTMLTAGTVLTLSQTVYIYAVDAVSGCSNQTTLAVNILSSGTAPSNVTACQSYTLPALDLGEYRTAAAGGGSVIPAGTVINATQVIYYFIPTAASCTQNNNFTVTITNNPVVTDLADVTSCGPFTLPVLPNGEKYYTGPGGTGTLLNAGAAINTSQTLYIYVTNPANVQCTAQSSFAITIDNVAITPSTDIERCGNYSLPALAVGNYYTGPGGTGSQIPAGTSINTSQTVYIYAVSPTNPSCFQEDSFEVTIYPRPALPNYANVSACVSYTVPAPPAGANFYTLPNGGGTLLPGGSVITSSQNIYVYAVGGPPLFCTREKNFSVTIININTITPNDFTVCNSYTIPSLPEGVTYYSGPGATGTQYQQGNVINSTQTIYVYAVSNSTPVCVQEDSFVVTIQPLPAVAPVAPVIACTSYTLPPLAVGNYFTATQGGGTMLPAGTVLTSSQVIYVYAQSGGVPNCTRQRSFQVTILPASVVSPPNITACTSYTLPALPSGNYFTAPSGGGTMLPAGTVITTNQTLYIYSPVTTGTNCTTFSDFTVTIVAPVTADDPADQVTCTGYILPALTNGNYYTAPGGGGTMLPAGTAITSSQTIYVYNTVPNSINCAVENSFTVTVLTIDVADMDDVTVCEPGYMLPELASGNYYTAPNGGGTPLSAGDVVGTSGTIYIYGVTTTTPPCSDEENFVVTVLPSPVIDHPDNVGTCGTFTLPALTNGNYYTGPGATGTALSAGQVISDTQDIYIFAQSGGTPNCVSEHMFSVIINPGPPVDVTSCGTYILPELSVGNYFSGPAGTGTPYFAGDVISATQQMYVYVQMTETPNCTDNNSFVITIVPYPVLAPVEDIVMCDVYQLPDITVGNYYTGPDGTGVMLADGSFITTTQQLWVYADTDTNPNCVAQETFNVTIFATPQVDARSDALACDEFILDDLLVGNYYTGPGGTGDMLTAGTAIESTQTLYIYAENPLHPECNAENSFLIEVFTITADSPDPVSECDSYMLPALTVGDYYELPGGPEVPGQIVYNAGDVITSTKTLYVYAETGGRINCTDENSFTITIFQTPVVDDTQTDIALCNTPYVLPALTTGNYYTEPLGTGQQLPVGYNVTTPMTIYIYASAPGSFGECFDQHSFFADVNFVSVTAPAGGNYCGLYILPVLANGNYFTESGGNGTMLSAGDAIFDTQEIFVYDEAGTTPVCSAEASFTVTIIQAPVPNQPDPLETCETDNNLHGVFNLVPSLNFALGGQSNAAASIHETIEDAEFGENEITDLTNYTNNTNNGIQVLYIRLYSTVTDCYNIVALTLIVNPRPAATVSSDYNICDNDTDGFAVFNLETKTPQILGTLDPAQFTVTYHVSLTAAQQGTGAIPNVTNYNSNTTTLFVRVENNATGCVDIVNLELIVNPLPNAAAPTPYTLCDVINPGDEQEVFNLTTKITEIIGAQGGIVVTFHQTMAEAQAGTNAELTPTAYSNNETVETLFVRVEVEATGCFRVVLLDVRVEPLPVLNMPAEDEVTICDTDEDGVLTFNLVDLGQVLINNGQNITLAFYETFQNAEDQLFPIQNPQSYTNANPFTETVYVVATNTMTGCNSNPYILELFITPAPVLPELPNLVLCDQDNNGITAFNLSQQNAIIEGSFGVGPGGVTIRYYSTLANAQNGLPMITNITAFNGVDGQEIFVRVEDLDVDSDCFAIESFTLEVGTPLALVAPPMFTVCNSALPNLPATEIFDLTTQNNTILGPQGVGQGYTVQYYLTQADALGNLNVIANPTTFANTVNPQTLHVAVTTTEGCKSYTTLTVKVLPLPTPDTTPQALVTCDDDATGNAGEEQFDLTEAEADIRDNDNSTIVTYYTTLADAEAGTTTGQILNPGSYTSASGTVYVRVAANTNNPIDPVCYQIVELELIVNPLPALGDGGVVPPYAICEPNTDGFAIFDLNTHNDEVISGGDTTGYTFTYFRSAANEASNTNAIPLIGYQNEVQTQQTIFVRVVNTVTGCRIVSSFDLFVEEEAIANPVADVAVCDQLDGTNDGITNYDLTLFDAEVLGTQPQGQPGDGLFVVEYYTEDPQANPDATPIADPVNFRNETSPVDQIIYIRVYNDGTISKCSDYTSVLIHVEELPEPTLTGGTICVDYNTAEVIRTHTLDTGLDATHTFVWTFNGTPIAGATGPTYEATQAGTYNVTATSANGCISEPIADAIVLQSGPAAPIGAGYTVSNYFSDEQVITVNVEGYGTYEYSLDGGPWVESNIFTNVSAGDHTIQVRDITACSEFILTLEEVSTVDYPRYFTPNGDDYHETWNIKGLGDDNTDAKIYIFDRYGKLVKQISSQGEGWDGTMNGTMMPATDYWFKVMYRETVNGVLTMKEYKGHFAMKR